MNTFEKHFQYFQRFIDRILSWHPDYVVPVAKKGCKLLKASNTFNTIDTNLIRYRMFFEMNNINVKDKRIAIVDDATQYTATLKEYRGYFENLEANVKTFSFVGHEKLFEGHRWKYDELADIERYLPDPVYQEYILQQSYFLLNNAFQFDLDHIIFEMNWPSDQIADLLLVLNRKGLLLFIEDYFLKGKTERFSLTELTFFDCVPFFEDKTINMGPIKKIKFVYNTDDEKLFFSPLVFPTWNYQDATFNGALFENVRFSLPFKIPSSIDKRNRGALVKIYNNIYFVYAASLAKSFVQVLQEHFNISENIDIRRNDLDAIYGVEITDRLITSIKKFVTLEEAVDFKDPSRRNFQIVRSESKKRTFRDFSQVISELKQKYEQKVRVKKTRIGVHHFIPYDILFESSSDKIKLSEDLDYYCDFGVIVPETIFRQGRILRACRTGEPNSEYNWYRTQVLIPIVIEQVHKEVKGNGKGVPAMLLNKLLSNFVYDYPSEHHHELHCLIGEPFTFGTLVRAYHHHRAAGKPSVYHAKKISPYYFWDKNGGQFFSKNMPEVTKKIVYLFDDKQEISYSEIIIYFRLLLRIYNLFGKVDVLNMLSICREENYFYSHVLYNIRMWTSEYGNYIDCQDNDEKIEYLHESGTQANSAFEKIRLAREISEVIETVRNKFGSEIEFIKAVEKVQKNYIPFEKRFLDMLGLIENIVKFELIATNVSLIVETSDAKYEMKIQELGGKGLLSDYGVKLPDNPLSLDKNSQTYRIWISNVYNEIKTLIDSLGAEEPLLSTRLQNEEAVRARNIATYHVYSQNLLQAVILFIDFTGLRKIHEPKEVIVSRYYRVVERNIERRSGVKLYGGKGGDDAFTIIFSDIMPCIECAKDIKKEFSEDLFLSQSGDVKFGLSYVIFESVKKEQSVIECWGTAKDCCEFKSASFRNKGHLIVSAETIGAMEKKGRDDLLGKFIKLEGERLKNERASQIYYFNEIKPLRG